MSEVYCPAYPRSAKIPKCDPAICDCFVDQCPDCAAGNCPKGGIHPEFFIVGGTDE